MTEASLRSGGADGGGRAPRFVTIVSAPSQEVAYDLAWVHVTVVPLVSHDAAAVQKQYQWGREDTGPFLTPEQYEAGMGKWAEMGDEAIPHARAVRSRWGQLHLCGMVMES